MNIYIYIYKLTTLEFNVHYKKYTFEVSTNLNQYRQSQQKRKKKRGEKKKSQYRQKYSTSITYLSATIIFMRRNLFLYIYFNFEDNC